METFKEKRKIEMDKYLNKTSNNQDRLERLQAIAESLYKQQYGLLNNWAGVFNSCDQHSHREYLYADWYTEECPMCAMEKYNREFK